MFNKVVAYAGTAIMGLAVAGALSWGEVSQTLAAPATQPAAVQLFQGEQAPDVQPLAPGDRGGRGERGERVKGAAVVAGLIKTTADLTKLEPAAVVTELKAGKSLAQIAAANGSSGDAVVQAAADKARQRLDQAVQRGRMTQAEADQMLAQLTDQARQLVNDTTLGQKIEQRAEQGRDRVVFAAMTKATADATGLTVREVAQRVRAGETLEQIAQSKGKNSAEIVDAATATFRAAAEKAMTETPAAP